MGNTGDVPATLSNLEGWTHRKAVAKGETSQACPLGNVMLMAQSQGVRSAFTVSTISPCSSTASQNIERLQYERDKTDHPADISASK